MAPSERRAFLAAVALLAAACGDGGSIASDGGADAATDGSGGVDAARDAGGADSGGMDAGSPDAGADAGGMDAGGMDGGPADGGPLDAGTPDAPRVCPPADVTDFDRHVFVDLAALPGGNGSEPCPLRTILEGLDLTSAGSGRLTVHVRGATPANVYSETEPLFVGGSTTLTSAWPPAAGDRASVVIRANGPCRTFYPARCAVQVAGGRVEHVTVQTSPGGTAHAFLTSHSTPPPVITNAIATAASGNGIHTLGSVTLGPNVDSVMNLGSGIGTQMIPGSDPRPTGVVVQIVGPSGATAPVNHFDDNGAYGVYLLYHATLDAQWLTANRNGTAGMFLSSTTATGTLGHVEVSDNAQRGISVHMSLDVEDAVVASNGMAGIDASSASSITVTLTDVVATDNDDHGVILSDGTFTVTNLASSGHHRTGAGYHRAGLAVARGELTLRRSVLLDNDNGLQASGSTVDLGTGASAGGNSFGAPTGGNVRSGTCFIGTTGVTGPPPMRISAQGNGWAVCSPMETGFASGVSCNNYAGAYSDILRDSGTPPLVDTTGCAVGPL